MRLKIIAGVMILACSPIAHATAQFESEIACLLNTSARSPLSYADFSKHAVYQIRDVAGQPSVLVYTAKAIYAARLPAEFVTRREQFLKLNQQMATRVKHGKSSIELSAKLGALETELTSAFDIEVPGAGRTSITYQAIRGAPSALEQLLPTGPAVSATYPLVAGDSIGPETQAHLKRAMLDSIGQVKSNYDRIAGRPGASAKVAQRSLEDCQVVRGDADVVKAATHEIQKLDRSRSEGNAGSGGNATRKSTGRGAL